MKNLFTINLQTPVVLSEMVGSLQTLKGLSFGEVAYTIEKSGLTLYSARYIPSLDGWLNHFTPVSVGEIVFTNARRPPRVEHLLSAIRVVFRSGFTELEALATEFDRLIIRTA